MKVKRLAVWVSLAVGFLSVAVFAALSRQKPSVEPKGHVFSAISIDGCTKQYWQPEVFSFYGDPAAVGAKVENFDMHLSSHRVFMFIAESSDSAHISLFEGVEGSKVEKDDKEPEYKQFDVWTLEGKSATELREKATNEILATKGYLCVGAQIKSLVIARNPKSEKAISAPKTGRAVFNHLVDGFDGQYIRLTVFLLC